MRHCVVAIAVLVAAAASSASPGPPTSYNATRFRPAFTLRLPAGWMVAERDESGAQIWRRCKTCPYDGEENGEVTLDMTLGEMTPSQAIARLRKAVNLHAGPTRSARLGTSSGFEFTGSRTGAGNVLFQDSGYQTGPEGAPLEILVVKAAGRTVTIVIDPGTSRGKAARTFTAAALAVAKTIRFTR